MWSTITKFLGLSKDEDSDDSDQDQSVDGPSGSPDCTVSSSEPSSGIEEREFTGIVTSLHSAYGLINNEIVFTLETICSGVMPKVGDTVQVLSYRNNAVGGWRARRVLALPSKDFDSNDESDGGDDDVNMTVGDFDEISRKERHAERKARQEAEQEREILFADKNSISISKFIDFGKLELGQSMSLRVTISNTGTEPQKLLQCSFSTFCDSSQFELGQVQLDVVDISVSSRKAQQSLPLILDAGNSASFTVFCTARYLGAQRQTLLCEFDGFAIGRLVTVSVHDLAQLALQPTAPFQRTKARNQYETSQQQQPNSWLVPGQKPTSSGMSVRLPSRLPNYPVPETLRRRVVEGSDVTAVAPSLRKPLAIDSYAQRFSALLHLEEIQQEIDIREYDIDNVCLRPVGEFLVLQVPGLAEGRPSVLVGDRVILSDSDVASFSPSYEGFVHEVLKDELLLKFSQDFHDNYSDKEYDVQFTFNRSTFRRCHFAVEFARRVPREVTFPSVVKLKASQVQNTSTVAADASLAKATTSGVGIHRCPLGVKATVTSSKLTSTKFYNQLLNSRQRSAVTRILAGQCRPMPYIIFGPPGTGKTVTVVEGILQIFHNVSNCRMLACTPSNSAADLLTERLHDGGVGLRDMVRLNAFRRSDEGIPDSIRPYCSDGEDLSMVAVKKIIVCTCSTAGSFYALNLLSTHFTHVFVDEAGQATEPECMIAVGLVANGSGQIILAGDPMQLGPVLRSGLAKDYGLQISYLERIMSLPPYLRDAAKFVNHGSYDPMVVTKLVENYRSHPALIQLPSDVFYNSELVVSADKSLVECLCAWDKLPNKRFPLLFHGIRGEDLREGNSPSWFNPQEAVQVMKYLQAIVHNGFYSLTFDDIGIITPYRKQVEKIRLLINKLGMDRVKVGSVEEFQGQERLVMIISTVRSQDSLVSVDLRYTLGFLSNPKRFNVAVTRAHALLVIVGNPHVLAQDYYWALLIKYCIDNGAYIGCDPPVLGPSFSISAVAPSADDQAEQDDVNLAADVALAVSASGVVELVTPASGVVELVTPASGVVELITPAYDSSVTPVGILTSASPGEQAVVESQAQQNQQQIVDENLAENNISKNSILTDNVEAAVLFCEHANIDEIPTVSSSGISHHQPHSAGDHTDVNESVDLPSSPVLDSKKPEVVSTDSSLQENVIVSPSPSVNFPGDHSSRCAFDDSGNSRESPSYLVKPEDLVNSMWERTLAQEIARYHLAVHTEDYTTLKDTAELAMNAELCVGKEAELDEQEVEERNCMVEASTESSRQDIEQLALVNEVEMTLELKPPSAFVTLSNDFDEFVTDVRPNHLSLDGSETCSGQSEVTKDTAVLTADGPMSETSTGIMEMPNTDTSICLDLPSGKGNSPDVPETWNYSSQAEICDLSTMSPTEAKEETASQHPLPENASATRLDLEELLCIPDVSLVQPGARLLTGTVQPTILPAGSVSLSSLSDLDRKIVHQMEYYFGDFNMMKDRFLMDQMKKGLDGWIPLSVIMTFNRMKALTTDLSVVVDAVNKSTSGLIQTSIDGLYVRRSPLKPIVTDPFTWKNDAKTNSVVIEKYPTSESLDEMQAVFEKYGSISHIERRIPKYSAIRGYGVEYVDLVIFLNQEGVKNIVKVRYTAIKRMGLSIHYGNQIVDDCVDYFYAKRVLGTPWSQLKPIRSMPRGSTRDFSANSTDLPSAGSDLEPGGNLPAEDNNNGSIQSGRRPYQRNTWRRSYPASGSSSIPPPNVDNCYPSRDIRLDNVSGPPSSPGRSSSAVTGSQGYNAGLSGNQSDGNIDVLLSSLDQMSFKPPGENDLQTVGCDPRRMAVPIRRQQEAFEWDEDESSVDKQEDDRHQKIVEWLENTVKPAFGETAVHLESRPRFTPRFTPSRPDGRQSSRSSRKDVTIRDRNDDSDKSGADIFPVLFISPATRKSTSEAIPKPGLGSPQRAMESPAPIDLPLPDFTIPKPLSPYRRGGLSYLPPSRGATTSPCQNSNVTSLPGVGRGMFSTGSPSRNCISPLTSSTSPTGDKNLQTHDSGLPDSDISTNHTQPIPSTSAPKPMVSRLIDREAESASNDVSFATRNLLEQQDDDIIIESSCEEDDLSDDEDPIVTSVVSGGDRLNENWT